MRKSGKLFWDFMPRTIVGLGVAVGTMIQGAWAVTTLPSNPEVISPSINCWSLTPPAGCNSTATASSTTCTTGSTGICKTCVDSTTTNFNLGIATITEKSVITTCSSTNPAIYNCSCKTGATTYECIEGFYGTAAATGTYGCTKCPDNATCAGGNGSTFVCNTGYYKYDKKCLECPDNYNICNNLVVSCKAGYYRREEVGTGQYFCDPCPTITDDDTGLRIYSNTQLSTFARGTSAVGATTVSRCYWAAGTYYDETGTINIGSGASATTCPYSSL